MNKSDDGDDGPVEQPAYIRSTKALVRKVARENDCTTNDVWAEVAEFCRRRNEARRKGTMDAAGNGWM